MIPQPIINPTNKRPMKVSDFLGTQPVEGQSAFSAINPATGEVQEFCRGSFHHFPELEWLIEKHHDILKWHVTGPEAEADIKKYRVQHEKNEAFWAAQYPQQKTEP